MHYKVDRLSILAGVETKETLAEERVAGQVGGKGARTIKNVDDQQSSLNAFGWILDKIDFANVLDKKVGMPRIGFKKGHAIPFYQMTDAEVAVVTKEVVRELKDLDKADDGDRLETWLGMDTLEEAEPLRSNLQAALESGDRVAIELLVKAVGEGRARSNGAPYLIGRVDYNSDKKYCYYIIDPDHPAAPASAKGKLTFLAGRKSDGKLLSKTPYPIKPGSPIGDAALVLVQQRSSNVTDPAALKTALESMVSGIPDSGKAKLDSLVTSGALEKHKIKGGFSRWAIDNYGAELDKLVAAVKGTEKALMVGADRNHAGYFMGDFIRYINNTEKKSSDGVTDLYVPAVKGVTLATLEEVAQLQESLFSGKKKLFQLLSEDAPVSLFDALVAIGDETGDERIKIEKPAAGPAADADPAAGPAADADPAAEEAPAEEAPAEEAPADGPIEIEPLTLLFETDKSEVTSSATEAIKTWLESIEKTGRDFTLEVEGHTSTPRFTSDDAERTPTEMEALDSTLDELGSNRAENVEEHLASLYVWLIKEDGYVTTSSYGGTRPIDTNRTPTGRKENDRVVINVVFDDLKPGDTHPDHANIVFTRFDWEDGADSWDPAEGYEWATDTPDDWTVVEKDDAGGPTKLDAEGVTVEYKKLTSLPSGPPATRIDGFYEESQLEDGGPKEYLIVGDAALALGGPDEADLTIINLDPRTEGAEKPTEDTPVFLAGTSWKTNFSVPLLVPDPTHLEILSLELVNDTIKLAGKVGVRGSEIELDADSMGTFSSNALGDQDFEIKQDGQTVHFKKLGKTFYISIEDKSTLELLEEIVLPTSRWLKLAGL